jgi:DAK2 domain fusion protein YloV
MSKAFANLEEVDAEDIARAFRRGTDEAYKAVMNPTEGTILTVMRRCTEAAEQAVADGKFKGDPRSFFEYIVDIGDVALAETPEMLPILKEVNVVDAGGKGFMVALNGMLSALNNNPVILLDSASENKEADFESFDTESITFPYCTECIVEKDEKYQGEGQATAVNEFICSIGDSAVFIEDESIIKIHVHTDHPGLVLEKAGEYGMLITVKIENMRKQHSALVSDAKESKKEEPKILAPEKPFGFVSVCMGQGISDTFRDLGADYIIHGGQTMNPSTQDIIDGVNMTPAETVYVLPNNKNIYLVAVQAAKLVSDKKVVVLETRSVPQGISAILSFDPDASEEDNTAAMQDAIGGVISMSVTHAVRDTTIEGRKIEDGQMLGMLDGKINCVANSSLECLEALIENAKDSAFITVFYGEDIDEETAAKAEEILQAKLPSAEEITVIPGGQPIYDFIISAEG